MYLNKFILGSVVVGAAALTSVSCGKRTENSTEEPAQVEENTVEKSTEKAVQDTEKSSEKIAEEADQTQKVEAVDPIKTVEIVGSWEGPCIKSDSLKGGIRVSFKFDPNVFQKEVVLFADDKCETRNVSIVTSGDYTLASDSVIGQNAHVLNYNYKNVVVKPLTEAGVKALKIGTIRGVRGWKVCGVKKWEVNQEIDLTSMAGKPGCIFAALPLSESDSVQLDEKTLQTDKLGALGAPFTPKNVFKGAFSALFVRK